MFKRLKLNDMKKIFSLLSILCVAICAGAETVFEFTTSDWDLQEKDGIYVALSKGSGNAPLFTADYETKTPEMRLYVGNQIEISADSPMKNIQIVFARSSASKGEYSDLSASVGTLVSGGTSKDKTDKKIDVWTGNAKDVVFTLVAPGKQRQIFKIVVDGAPITLEDETIPLPTEADLKADYEYSEPTVVHPKDTTIFKKEYAFIENNILVHCDSGSIIKATDTTFAYFNCPVGSKLTFTATQNIKGIAIDGFVRKAFDGITCETGSVTYLTDPDADEEGFPAIVIQDVNAKSVTLSCPKQFRCYELRVYFKENPEAIDMGGEEPKDPEDPEEPEDPENPEDQAIDNVQNNDVPSTKVLRDGQLIILRGDKEYNSLGTQL